MTHFNYTINNFSTVYLYGHPVQEINCKRENTGKGTRQGIN